MWLLCADLHLTDNPIEEYRWDFFAQLPAIIKHENVTHLFVLGDLVDRKDKHSSTLVNRLINCFGKLVIDTGIKVTILAGNHDKPINGPYYWQFLSSEELNYVTKPILFAGVWLLPFSSEPVEDWRELDLASAKAIFMHQTVVGSLLDGDRRIDFAPYSMPPLPRIPIFSGDVHRPQEIAGLTYVGTPYPIRFGENWKNRVLVVKEKTLQHKEILTTAIKRTILDIQSTKELPVSFKQNDQVRIRYRLSSYSLADWPLEQAAIKKWADEFGVNVLSIEAVLGGEGVEQTDTKISKLETMSHEDVVRLFAIEKQLDPGLIDIGLQLVKESI